MSKDLESPEERYLRREISNLKADLARHKAALRIARVALTNESRNSKDKTSRDVAVTALQQIDKLLTPKP